MPKQHLRARSAGWSRRVQRSPGLAAGSALRSRTQLSPHTCTFPPSTNWSFLSRATDVKLPSPWCAVKDQPRSPVRSLPALAAEGYAQPVSVVPSLLVPCCAHSGTTFLWRCALYAFHPQKVSCSLLLVTPSSLVVSPLLLAVPTTSLFADDDDDEHDGVPPASTGLYGDGYDHGYDDGYDQGRYSLGYDDGHAAGFDDGYDGAADERSVADGESESHEQDEEIDDAEQADDDAAEQADDHSDARSDDGQYDSGYESSPPD
jgi:hypothetical protein